MTRKKQTRQTETPTNSPEGQAPSTSSELAPSLSQGQAPVSSTGQVLLEALRSNLSLLGELAVRYDVATRPVRPANLPAINCPQDVHNLLWAEMSLLAQEQLRVLLLDRRNRVLGQRVVYQGNVFSSVVRPAEVFRPAVVESAPAVIVVHNHPSSDPTPSPEDVAITRDLSAAGKLLGIDLLDHVVIGGDGFVSLSERGLMTG